MKIKIGGAHTLSPGNHSLLLKPDHDLPKLNPSFSQKPLPPSPCSAATTNPFAMASVSSSSSSALAANDKLLSITYLQVSDVPIHAKKAFKSFVIANMLFLSPSYSLR